MPYKETMFTKVLRREYEVSYTEGSDAHGLKRDLAKVPDNAALKDVNVDSDEWGRETFTLTWEREEPIKEGSSEVA